ncbi:MAG: exosortase-associated EpsI family protein [Candidatus Synoicihabitans palmerolidicus]|nr:exosortase-associated EpsI family protein [Candidatus Synoicihabitans palmerolidicus]
MDDRQQQVLISVVLSGQDRTSIHRPELCLVGQGWTLGELTTTRFGGGNGVAAALWNLEREMPAGKGEARVPVKSLFAYWFVGRDRVETTTAGRL